MENLVEVTLASASLPGHDTSTPPAILGGISVLFYRASLLPLAMTSTVSQQLRLLI